MNKPNKKNKQSQFHFKFISKDIIEIPQLITQSNSYPKTHIKTCSCKKSKCLKLYCECFANNSKCNEYCGCSNCYNTEAYSDLRELIMKQIKQNNPCAFTSKIKKQGDSVKIHFKGCNCSKSKCRKAYCECFKLGIGCSKICKCIDCENKTKEKSPLPCQIKLKQDIKDSDSFLLDFYFDKYTKLKRHKKE